MKSLAIAVLFAVGAPVWAQESGLQADLRKEAERFSESCAEFKAILERAGVAVTQRVQRGADVAAACGQLRALTKKSADDSAASIALGAGFAGPTAL